MKIYGLTNCFCLINFLSKLGYLFFQDLHPSIHLTLFDKLIFSLPKIKRKSSIKSFTSQLNVS